jgi:AcrR family transcriptional regulator
MPKPFSEDERDRIRAQLVDAGRECFTRFGPEKTTIEDLTSRVGIAKGSFYLFFDSKESLYVQLLLEEAPAMMRRIAAVSFETEAPTRDAVVELLRAIVREIEGNPFARALLDEPGQWERFANAVDVAAILEGASELFRPLVAWLAAGQRRGEIRAGDPQELVYAMALIKLLPLNRGRMPPELYDRMLQLLPELLADGMTSVNGSTEVDS